MNFCKYHPLLPATYECHHCEMGLCDSCANEEPANHLDESCFVCETTLENLGAGHTVEPFWRRLQEAFRYPLNSNTLTFLGIVAVGTTILSYVSFFIVTVFAWLALSGAMLKYCFRCLEDTAQGDMNAPDINDAYSGGLGLMLRLFLLVICIGVLLVLVAVYIGPGLTMFLGMLVYIGFPAIIIRFAQTESVIAALNPIACFQLVLAIGFPYGVLLGLLVVMMGSVAFLHEIIGTQYTLISNVASTLILDYYLVVAFHIMGYMLFQYQSQLGFSARIGDNISNRRTEPERYLANIDIHIKEGRYEKAVDIFHGAFKKFPKELRFFENYYNFLLRAEKSVLLAEFADEYMQALMRSHKFDKLGSVYKQITTLVPKYFPKDPLARLSIARVENTHGNYTTVVKLLNGLHKQFPAFEQLHDAYFLMAAALAELPNMDTQADKCRRLAENLQAQLNAKAKAAGNSQAVKKSVFTSQSPTQPLNVASENTAAREPGLEYQESGGQEKAGPIETEASSDQKDLPPIEFKL